MTVNTYDFEGTPNATISGTGITLTGSGQAVYDTGVAAVGSTGAKFTATAGQVRSARLDITTPSVTMGIDAIITLPVLPGAGVRYTVLTARRSGGVAASVQYDPNGQLCLTTTGRIDTFSAAGLAAGSKIRIQLLLNVVSGTTSTAVAKAYTSGSNWTTQSGTTFTSGAILDMGTAAINQVDVGALLAATPGLIVGADYVRAEDGRTTDFSAPPAAGATVAAAGVNNPDPEVGTTVTLSASGSTGSGTLTYSWACTARPEGAPLPAITNPTSSSATVTPDTNGVYTFTVTVTGSGGADTETVDVYVYQHSAQSILIRSVDAGTTWTNEGGAATYTAALNDTSTATHNDSPDSPTTADIEKGTLAPAGPGTNKFQVWASCTTGSATLTVQVRDATDATVIQETVDSAIGTTEKLVEVVLQSDDLATYSFASGARRALRWRWFATTP